MKKAMSLVVIFIFTSGCAMMKEATKHSVALTAVQWAYIAAETVEDKFQKYREELGLPHLDIEVKEKIKAEGYDYEYASVNAQFSIKPFKEKILFSPNKYLTNHSQMHSAYALAVASYLELIKKYLSKTGAQVKKIDVQFRGSADGLGHARYVGRYRGECGRIQERFLMGGADRSVVIRKGDRITNMELAAVRAYCMYYDFMSKSEKLEITEEDFNDISFFASENERIGDAYRFAKIIISIKDPS